MAAVSTTIGAIPTSHHKEELSLINTRSCEIAGPSLDIVQASQHNCSEGDIARVVQLVNDAYWKMQKPYFTDSEFSRKRVDEAEIKEIMDNANEKLFLLRDQVAILGVIKLELDPTTNSAKFGLFAIDKDYHGKKLGNCLLTHVEKYARDCGKKFMKIEVFVFAKRLAEYYAKLGYKPTGNMNTFFHDSCIRPQYQDIKKRYLLELTKELL